MKKFILSLVLLFNGNIGMVGIIISELCTDNISKAGLLDTLYFTGMLLVFFIFWLMFMIGLFMAISCVRRDKNQ
ncbi:MAG: hypothetical protein VB070_13330 [Clostridiaceae bacterium]|nr:hypothetical protein [Clostridiaceae bacterium]